MVVLHVDAQAVELDAFGLEAHTLFETVFAGEEDFAAGTYDALPGNGASGAVQSPCGLTGSAGESCGIGDVPVGGDLAARDAGHDPVVDAPTLRGVAPTRHPGRGGPVSLANHPPEITLRK